MIRDVRQDLSYDAVGSAIYSNALTEVKTSWQTQPSEMNEDAVNAIMLVTKFRQTTNHASASASVGRARSGGQRFILSAHHGVLDFALLSRRDDQLSICPTCAYLY